MKTCLQPVARVAAPLTPTLQLIAVTAASWNLIAPARPRKRVRRIPLRSLARTSCTAAGSAA